jgi:hypothetical protein
VLQGSQSDGRCAIPLFNPNYRCSKGILEWKCLSAGGGQHPGELGVYSRYSKTQTRHSEEESPDGKSIVRLSPAGARGVADRSELS